MEKWTPVQKFARLFSLGLFCIALSRLLPLRLVSPIDQVWEWLKNWGPVALVLGLALLGYFLANWVPRYNWKTIKKHVVGTLFFVELVLMLISKFWYAAGGGIWAAVCGFATLVTITHLSHDFTQSHSPGSTAPDEINENPCFLVDAPISTPDEDSLRRNTLAEAIVHSIEDYAEAAPITVSINGGWGTGKSSVMKLMQHALEKAGHKTAWVNVWIYDTKASIWKAMVQSIIDLMKEHHLPVNLLTSVNGYYKAAREVVKSQDKLKWLGALMQDMPSTEGLEELKEQVSSLIKDLVGDKKLVVFVDDLDRCAPESILGTLEFLKEIVDFKHCVFVVGIDRDSIERVLEQRYQAKGRDFLRKIINVSVDLSNSRSQHFGQLFAQHVMRMTALPTRIVDQDMPFIFQVVDGNPRAIKQVLNSFLVVRKLLEPILDLEHPEIIQALLFSELLRFRFPDVHHRLGDEATFGRLRVHYGPYLQNRRQSSWPRTRADEAEQKWCKILGEELKVTTEDAQWISHLLEFGGFMTSVSLILSVPKSIFFTYVDPPSWIPESRIIDLLRQIRDKSTTVSAVLRGLLNENVEKAREFVSRCVDFKNEIYRANEQVYTNSGLAEFDNTSLRNILTEVIEFQRTFEAEVFPRKNVQPLLSSESKRESESDALALAREILDPEAWSAEALFEITRGTQTREYTLSPSIEQEFQRLHWEAFKSLWQTTLRDLGTDPLIEEHPLFHTVVNLETDFIAYPEVHQALIKAAEEHRDSERWVTNFRMLLLSWLESARVVRLDAFRGVWIKADDTGLITALDQAVARLDLRPEGRERFFKDIEGLQQMISRFRSGQGFEDEDVPGADA